MTDCTVCFWLIRLLVVLSLVGGGAFLPPSIVWRLSMSKVRLCVCVRGQGARIESVPLKDLEKLSDCRKKQWKFEDGWLILDAYGGLEL